MIKNPAAVVLGRKGGSKGTKAQKAARIANLIKARKSLRSRVKGKGGK